MRSVSGQRTAEPYLSNGRVSDPPRISAQRGYVAVTIADEQPPAVANADAQQGTDAPPAARPDEISGLGVRFSAYAALDHRS